MTTLKRLSKRRRWLPAVAVVAALVTGCLPVVDDPAARDRVIGMLRAGELATVDDWRKDVIYLLPADLDQLSEGGEIAVERSDNALVVVFFDFRGLNHYTGWMYSSGVAPIDDPFGNESFSAAKIVPHWYRVDAG